MKKAMIFNIQRFSIQDGPGIRSTVFFKGCPLECYWCSNPESQGEFPEITHRSTLCNACGKCLTVCDKKALSVNSNKITIDRQACNNCAKCVETCVYGALNIMGKLMTLEEVLSEITRDIDFYKQSDGGITASGGEPLMQGEFVTELFQICWQKGIHTTLDTCGYAAPTILRKVLTYTNLVLYDIKLMDPILHERFTNKANQTILRNAQKVDNSGVQKIIRIPLISSINCYEENIHAIATFVKEFKHKTPVELLPYHRMGLSKYGSLDRLCKINDEDIPAENFVQRIKLIFETYDIECRISN
jgi:pyruvate formate lyase activating enzyme